MMSKRNRCPLLMEDRICEPSLILARRGDEIIPFLCMMVDHYKGCEVYLKYGKS